MLVFHATLRPPGRTWKETAVAHWWAALFRDLSLPFQGQGHALRQRVAIDGSRECLHWFRKICAVHPIDPLRKQTVKTCGLEYESLPVTH